MRCRKHGLIPTHISNRTNDFHSLFQYRDARTASEVQLFQNRLVNRALNLEISITVRNLDHISRQLTDLESNIRGFLPQDTWSEFVHRMTPKWNRHFDNTKRRNLNKFHRLLNTQIKPIKVQERWVKNISDVQLPSEVVTILALGPKFSIEPTSRELSIPRLLSEVELSNVNRPTQEKNLTTAKVANVITNYVQRQSVDASPFSRLYIKARSFLRNHPDLLVLQADKGSVTVVIKKEEYSTLSNEMLNDELTYKKLQRDPTSTYQQRANKLITSLKRDDLIEEDTAKSLMVYNSVAPKYYGLPKIHKPQLKLRPIISSIDSPSGRIARFLTDILTSAYSTENDYYVKNSAAFSTLVNDTTIPNDYVIISLDVVSLFTNIPKELVFSSIEKRWELIGTVCNIPKDRFLSLVDFVFDTTYFVYENIFYKQISGTPMGAIISPILAQYVMDDALDACISKLPFTMPFCKKYVDDIICSIPATAVNLVISVFNQYHPKIQYTVEEESDFGVPFLDMRVIRHDTVLKTDWYTKPTYSGRYINYHSYHPIKTKINVILNMKKRILDVSHESFRQKNLKRLHDILVENCYPRSLLCKLIFSTSNPQSPTTRQQVDEDRPLVRYKPLPYIKSLAFRLVPLIKTSDTDRVAYRSIKTVKNLFSKVKDRTPVLQQSGVVYCISCVNCSRSYIGQTSRVLKDRITSHKSDIRRRTGACALTRHVNETGHHMDFKNTTILDKERSCFRRTFLEMVRIHQTPEALNSKKDIDGLSSIYTFLLELDRSQHTRPRATTHEDDLEMSL